MNWYQLTIEEVFEKIGSSKQGLSSGDAASAKNKYGPNELTEGKKIPMWAHFIRQFKSFMIIVLIVAAIISGFAGDTTDTIIILVIVFLNAVIGFIQEYNAEKAMSSLKKMSTPFSRVIRDHKEINIESAELVPGDVVILEAA